MNCAPRPPRSGKEKVRHGHIDDDALAFAIFTRDGKMALNDGENGEDIQWNSQREGFSDGYLRDDDDEWRFLWLTTADGRYRIAVGREWDYRREMAMDIVTSQLTPWMVALPLMFVLLIVLLSRELAPLKIWRARCACARRTRRIRSAWRRSPPKFARWSKR